MIGWQSIFTEENMNSIWSDHVQGVMTLYLSRKLRFDDIFFAQYEKLFNLDHNRDLKILEIGCGPGALAESLHRWYPKALHPYVQGTDILADDRLRVGGKDTKWSISKDGTYRITIDLFNEKVKAEIIK